MNPPAKRMIWNREGNRFLIYLNGGLVIAGMASKSSPTIIAIALDGPLIE